MRHVTPDGLALVKRFEGFSPTPYLCPANRWTIGFGSTRGLDGLPVTAATAPITSEEADALLARDLEDAERAVLRLIKVPLTDGQFDALCDFAFNLGSGSLQRSTLRAKVNRGEHGDVPGEFLKWCRGGGRILPGLVRRRRAEAERYAST